MKERFSEFGKKKIDTAGKEKLERYFSQINSSARQMLYLVNDLLDITKLEQGKLEYHYGLNDIATVLNSIRDEIEGFVYEKGLKFDIVNNCKTLTASFDSFRILQVVRNISFNAIKFSEPGDYLLLRVEDSTMMFNGEEVPSWRLMIVDEGQGIPNNEIEFVFKKYEQGSRNKGAGGTGLGLAISHKIIKDHNGKIWAEHNPSGRGTVFIFEIPSKLTNVIPIKAAS
jgi:signal transduction histidine kinase